MQQPQAVDCLSLGAPWLVQGRGAFNVGTARPGLAPFGHCPGPVLPLGAVDSSLAIQDRPPVIGTHLPDYEGPERLDLAMLGRIRNHEVRATLGLSGIRASRYAVLAAGSQGWLRVTVPADPRGRLDVEDLLLAPLVGSRNTLPLITHLWPSVETSVDPRPVLYLEAYDDQGARIAASSRGIFLPLGRDIGKGLEAMRSGWWLSALLALLSLALLPVWRSRRSSPGSSDRARAPTGEAS